MTTEVVHSLVAECAESALTPTSPGSAVWEPQEHEYVLPHVGQPHSAFRETEGERRSRLSAQRIAQSSARLLTRKLKMYRPATLFQPSFLSKMVNSSELPFPSGQLQVAIDASLSEMANVGAMRPAACGRSA